jgi:Tol biopolymer transport system component
MLALRFAPTLSIVALVTAAFACGGSDTNPGGGTSTSTATGGGGSSPAVGLVVVPLAPTSGSPELFRMKPDGSELLQLTRFGDAGMPTDNNDFPVISPDHKTIVFASGRDHAPEVNPMRRAIYVMDIDGGNVHRLTAVSPDACTEYPGDISPDGKWVVFTRSCDESIDPVTGGLDKLFRIHLDGTGEEKLAPADPLVTSASNQDAPAFTPDGGAVVFVSDDELCKLDLATQKITQLTKAADAGRTMAVRRPMVTPKGDVVYALSYTSDFSSSRMEEIKLDGTGSEVAFDIASDPNTLAPTSDRFALSPAGDSFLFATNVGPDGAQAMVVTGLDGKNPKTIYPSAMFVGWGDPSWR